MTKDLFALLFAIAAGVTLSGIVANIYRIVARKPQTRPETVIYCAVMIAAGPNILFEKATKSLRTKACSRLAYGFAVALTGYWSFGLGLLVLSAYLKL
jgi:hypothetical protein